MAKKHSQRKRKLRPIDELRLEYDKQLKRVDAKIQRNKRDKGIIIAGTDYDPRLPKARVMKYNSRQLKAHIAKLKEFTGRRVQFYGGAGGRAISKHAYDQYVRDIKAAGERVNDLWLSMKDKRVYGSSYSIEEYVEANRIKHPHMSGNTHNPIAPPKPIPVHQLMSERALRIHQKSVKTKIKGNYAEYLTTSDFKSATDMLEFMDEQGMLADVKGLNKRQFMALWNYTDFSANASFSYEVIKKVVRGESNLRRWEESVFKDSISRMKKQIQWAYGLDI